MEEASAHNRLSDSGAESYGDFISKVAKMANIDDSQAKKEIENNPVNVRILDYIATNLKPKYKIGLLSNAATNWLDEILTPEQLRLFDELSLSFMTGFVKPDSRAYGDIVQKLRISPEEGVFIDDQPRYAEAAGKFGLNFITYTGFQDMRHELSKLLTDSDN